MQYEILNVTQGSQAWLDARKECDTASEAPSAKGVGKYMTRDQLLLQKKTGITKAVDAATQVLFDRGHKTEEMARAIAEKIIGEELYPITAKLTVNGLNLLASMDGLTMDGRIGFEHKLINADLIAQVELETLDPHYTVQMDQELAVTSAEKILFMVSDGTEENYRWMWYQTNDDKVTDLFNAWHQFHKDLEAYVPPTVVEKVEAETVQALPVPSVVVKGEITASNLDQITPKFDAYLGSIKTELATDQDFADAEANAKNCRETAKRIDALQENIIAQMVSVNEVNGILENYKEAFNKVGLRLEKAVKDQKENLKTTAILTAQHAYSAHVQLIEAETKPIRLNVPSPDFAGAIKGIKTVASMHSRINDALAAGKMAADAAGRDIRAKQAWLKENADGFQFLFNDIHTIIQKPLEDLQTLAKMRIAEHKEAEAEKAKALQAKAEADARAKIEAEQRAAEAEKVQPDQRANAEVAKPDSASADAVESVSQKVSSSPISKPQPADNPRMTIVRLVANHYGISEQNAEETIVGCFGLKKAA